MSMSYWAYETPVLILSQSEALELVCARAERDSEPLGIFDRNDPGWAEYWEDALNDVAWHLDDDNCVGFELWEGELPAGEAVKDADPFEETIWYVPARRAGGLFVAAYNSADDIVAEFHDDPEGLAYQRSPAWIRAHLAYISAAMYG